MTDKGFQDKIVKKLINIITIAPLSIAGLYCLILFYDFIFPPTKTSGDGNKETHTNFIKRMGYSGLVKIMGSFSWLFSILSGVFSSIWIFITYYRFSVINVLIFYLIFCYFISKSYQTNTFLNDWSHYINIVLILGGLSIIISIFNLFIKENNDESPFPENKGIGSKFAWTLKESIPMYKSIIGICLVLGIVFLTFYIMKMFRFLSSTVNSFLMVLVAIGIMFALFNIITKNPKLMSKIMSNKIFQLLYHTIFLIPCLVIYASNFIYNEIEDTPNIVWIVFLIELILIIAYFLFPIIEKWLFVNSVTKKDDLFYQQESLSQDKSIIMNENELSKLMDKLSVDWDKIISNNLYEKRNEKELKVYLMSRGYVTSQKDRKLNFVQRLFEHSLSLEAAITYVQVNTIVIIDLKKQISMQIANSKNLSKTRNDRNNMFKTKILLNKPIYLSKKKSLGSYESIGSRVGAFNYNYAVSAWVFMHDQPPSLRASSTKFTNILNYADKPKIQFKPSENKLRIIMSNSIDKENIVYETTDFPIQRWNNIVINYSGGTLDIFINGKLKSTTENIVPIMTYDGIDVGEDNGLSGGICNVVYFPQPLSLNKITEFYKTLRYKSPPVL